MKKEKQLLIKIEEELLKKYKKLCKSNGFNMSQRIRNYITEEVDKNYKNG